MGRGLTAAALAATLFSAGLPRFIPAAPAQELWTHWSIPGLVRAVAVADRQVWVGTTGGLIRYDLRNDTQAVYTVPGGLLSGIVVALASDPQGRIWAGTYGGGISRFDGKEWRVFTPYGAGDQRFGKGWRRYRPAEGLGDLWVYDLFFDRAGTLWAATWNGVSRLDGDRFHTYRTPDGLVDKWVYAVAAHPDGTLWFGTEQGVSAFDGKHWRSWTHAEGLGAPVSDRRDLPEGYVPPPHHREQKGLGRYHPNYVLSAAIDAQGNRWFGTWGGGLSRFDGKTWRSFTIQNGLSGDVVHALAVDRNGVLWAGTNGGVSRYDGTSFRNFGRADGLLSDAVFAVFIDRDNAKWFGGLGTLVRYEGG